MEGTIGLVESIRQKFLLALQPSLADARFRTAADPMPARCATRLLLELNRERENLPAATLNELEGYSSHLCGKPASDNTHLSPSGRFRLHYSTTGPNAVPDEDQSGTGIPDFIERAAFAADSSWSHQIGTLGFADPIVGIITPYEIHFKEFNLYGITCPAAPETYIILHRNYSGFPANEHTEGTQTGALYVTVAHELKHASQYATNEWQGEAGEFGWAEMDAVMIEEEVFPDVEDYQQYLYTSSSIFNSPGDPIPGSYWHATWMIWFSEVYGAEFWVDVWDRFQVEPERPFLDATREVLGLRGQTLEEAHSRNLLWHLGSGRDYALANEGFGDRLGYPNPSFDRTFQTVTDSLTPLQPIEPLAARFFRVRPTGIVFGEPVIRVQAPSDSLGLGIIGYFHDGSTQKELIVPGTGPYELKPGWDWGELREVTLLLVNTAEQGETDFSLFVDNNIPPEIALRQNYPNPFQNRTDIEFDLDRPADVTLELFDLLGKRVQTLYNGPAEPGTHTIGLSGSGLASGIYLYRLRAGQEVMIRKLVRIR